MAVRSATSLAAYPPSMSKLPESLLVLALAFALAASAYMHWQAGGSPFATANIETSADFISKLFHTGRFEEPQWWHGIGKSFGYLAIFPILLYTPFGIAKLLMRPRAPSHSSRG